MDTKKLLMGTIAGGIAYFFLGWIIYGMLLMDTMAAYSNPAVMRAETDMVWWAMIVGNLGYACLLTYVFLKWGNIASFGSGAQAGAVLTLLMSFSIDLMMYATSTVMTDPMGIVVDVVAATVMGGIVGGIIGVVMGMGAKSNGGTPTT